MVKALVILSFLCISSHLIFGQKILVIENVYTLKNFKYYQDNSIIVKIDGIDKKISDRIIDMTDSTVFFEISGEIPYMRIDQIYRENWLVQIIRGLSLLGGVAYFGIDSFNRLINNDAPVIDSGTAMISAGLVAASFIMAPLRYRKIRIGEKWHIKFIDLNSNTG